MKGSHRAPRPGDGEAKKGGEGPATRDLDVPCHINGASDRIRAQTCLALGLASGMISPAPNMPDEWRPSRRTMPTDSGGAQVPARAILWGPPKHCNTGHHGSLMATLSPAPELDQPFLIRNWMVRKFL